MLKPAFDPIRKKPVMTRLVLLLSASFAIIFSSCSKGPGTGGEASIQGKIYATYENKTCTIITGQGYASQVDVYIIYGNDPSFGNHVKTNYDGTFWFPYLRPGDYTIYVYSKDCADPSGQTAVKVAVSIGSKKQNVVLSDIDINQ